jgi:hypothetical protein
MGRRRSALTCVLALTELQFTDDVGQRGRRRFTLRLLGAAQILKILIVFESFCDGPELVDWKDNVLFGALLPYELRV